LRPSHCLRERYIEQLSDEVEHRGKDYGSAKKIKNPQTDLLVTREGSTKEEGNGDCEDQSIGYNVRDTRGVC